MIINPNESIQKRHALIRQLDSKVITQEQYDKEMSKLENKIETNVQKVLDKVVINDIQPLQVDKNVKPKEGNKMAKEKVEAQVEVKEVKEVKEKKVKTPRDESNASIIAKVLAMKTVKNIDQAADKAVEIKPGVDRKRIKSMIPVIIRETKEGKGRWKAFTWDETSYTLTPKA